MEAGNSIDLEDGFEAEPGSVFSATIDETDPTTKRATKKIIKAPVIYGKKYACGKQIYKSSATKDDAVNWKFSGGNLQLENGGEAFTLPPDLPKGQYVLTCSNVENERSKIIIVPSDRTCKVMGTLKDANTNESVNVLAYPNPTKNLAYIQLPKSKSGNRLVLQDANGTILKEVSNIEAEQYQLNLVDYATGMYVVSIINEKENYSFKIIKQ